MTIFQKQTAGGFGRAEGGNTNPGGSVGEMSRRSESHEAQEPTPKLAIEAEFPQSTEPHEREFIERVNAELDRRDYPLSRWLQAEWWRPAIVDEVPRYFGLIDRRLGCEGKIASTTLRWCHARYGHHSCGAITLCAYMWNASEYEAAQRVWSFIQHHKPAPSNLAA